MTLAIRFDMSQEACVALNYRLVQYLRLFRFLQPPPPPFPACTLIQLVMEHI